MSMAEAASPSSRVTAPGLVLPLRRLANAALVVWLVCAVLVNSGGLSFTSYRLSHLVVGALLVAYAISLLVCRKLPGPTILDAPLAVLLVVNALAVAMAPYRGSVSKRASRLLQWWSRSTRWSMPVR